MNQVVLREDAHRAGPLDRAERLIQGAAGGVVVGEEAGRLARAQEEMRERVGTILESAGLARGCGNHQVDSITRPSTG